jgi:hypothetical protein
VDRKRTKLDMDRDGGALHDILQMARNRMG